MAAFDYSTFRMISIAPLHTDPRVAHKCRGKMGRMFTKIGYGYAIKVSRPGYADSRHQENLLSCLVHPLYTVYVHRNIT